MGSALSWTRIHVTSMWKHGGASSSIERIPKTNKKMAFYSDREFGQFKQKPVQQTANLKVHRVLVPFCSSKDTDRVERQSTQIFRQSTRRSRFSRSDRLLYSSVCRNMLPSVAEVCRPEWNESAISDFFDSLSVTGASPQIVYCNCSVSARWCIQRTEFSKYCYRLLCSRSCFVFLMKVSCWQVQNRPSDGRCLVDNKINN